ncbi:MAG TPA: metallophosphoesterase [Thermoanaerobaculia bacterium]|jgi:UDP-2,3-diacylglucosamine hydrolase
MAVAIVADAHVGGPGGPVGPLLAQLVEVAARRPERLVLLGDVFQVWVGYPQYETPQIRSFLGAVGVVRAAGVPVHYIEGNRDFYLAESAGATAFDSVGSELAFESGGVRYLAVHGDGLNDRDRQYLAWRWLSKSALSRLVVRSLPARAVGRFVASTERRLTGTNFKHKIRVPEEAIRRYGERRLAEGHDVLLLGHFHQARAWRIAGGEIRLLEAWFSSRRVEWIG